MSTDDNDKTTTSSADICARCGIAEVDDIKLKICDGGCDLVKYCSDDCQENHREHHEQECKTRKAELHDKQLFTQPDSSHMGECSICCLPLPLDLEKSTLMSCCCKFICNGCNYANMKREHEQGLEHRCTFCRDPAPTSEEEYDKQIMERVKKNDPVAITEMGKLCRNKGDYGNALKYFTSAAELGDVAAHRWLGCFYYNGKGVDKDEEKAIHHFEMAAIGGHPNARGYLAFHEARNGRSERAAKHLIINANLGCDVAVKWMKDLFVQGTISKEEYAAALRAYQAAVNETKSAEREIGEAFYARS